MRVWEARGGACLHTLHGHAGTVWAVSFRPSCLARNATITTSAGLYLASAGHDGAVRLWDYESGDTVHVLEGAYASVTLR